MEPSPWSKQSSPSATLPGPPPQTIPPQQAQTLPPPQAGPQWGVPPHPASPTRPPRTVKPWAIAVTLLAVAVSAAVASGTTALWLSHEKQAASTSSSAPTTQSATPAPQFSPEQVSAAKDNLCRIFDVSVRGQEGQGGLRVEGNLNVPVVLRSLNSASAVQNALSPAVPPDVAKASRKYITTTLDQTTAAMGNIPASEGNRLTDIRNGAIHELLDVCGLPR
jgi:hypothetical protein